MNLGYIRQNESDVTIVSKLTATRAARPLTIDLVSGMPVSSHRWRLDAASMQYPAAQARVSYKAEGMKQMADREDGAEPLEEIQSLERVIQDKQPALSAAQARRDAARRVEAEQRRRLSAVEGRNQSFAARVYLKAKGVYLNGQSLDRGTLSIGNEALRFSGWRGSVSIPLRDIQKAELGPSFLPPRAGVPVIGRLFPGERRLATTLLLTVRDAQTSADHLVVVGDLPDAKEWAWQISLAEQREQARAAWQEAEAALREAQRALLSLEDEIRQLRSQQNKLRTAG